MDGSHLSSLDFKTTKANRGPKILPVILVLGVLFWIVATTGGRQVFVKEVLGEAYDSQAEHFLRGDVGVDIDAIRHEALIVNGKVRMYFGPFPAFVRMPLNYIYPNGRGYWSRICGFCAGMIALSAFAGLVRMCLRSSQLLPRWQNWLGNVCLIGFAFASPVLFFLGSPTIYNETIIWGLAWSLAALYFACRSRTAEGMVLTFSLIAFSFCAGAALLSRATFGAPFLLIAPLLALRLFRRNPIRNLAALFLPVGAAFLFYLFLTYAKFGDFSGMPLRYSVNSDQRQFALKHGLFRLERVPYSFADYFILRHPNLQHDPPFLRAERFNPSSYPTLYVMPFTETYSSLVWYSSWIVLGAVIGVAMLLRSGASDAVDRGIAVALFAQVIVILSFMGLAQRYTAEIYPFLVFCLVIFLRSGGTTLYRMRYAIIGLVALSVVINSLATASVLGRDGNLPVETRTFWTMDHPRK